MTVRRAHERIENDAEFAQEVVELRERLGRYTWEDLTPASPTRRAGLEYRDSAVCPSRQSRQPAGEVR